MTVWDKILSYCEPLWVMVLKGWKFVVTVYMLFVVTTAKIAPLARLLDLLSHTHTSRNKSQISQQCHGNDTHANAFYGDSRILK